MDVWNVRGYRLLEKKKKFFFSAQISALMCRIHLLPVAWKGCANSIMHFWGSERKYESISGALKVLPKQFMRVFSQQ